jgi:hypothetical protein
MVLQPQPKRSGIVCTLASGRISANSDKSGESSVVVQCECEAICQSTTWEGAQTPHICMTWIWDNVWKILQPQPKDSGMVCTLASGRISADSHKSGRVSVVVMMWMWSLMPTHNLRMCYGHWKQFERFLQPQPKRSSMVCTLASGRISTNSHITGEASVVVTVWVWSHMPTYNQRRCSNTSYMYDMDMGCSLKGSAASTKA